MNPEEMIGKLNDLADTVDVLASKVRNQTRLISGRWTRLGNIGAQRADHATKLMTDLIEPLREMQDFADIAVMQIKVMSAKPFASDRSSTWGA